MPGYALLPSVEAPTSRLSFRLSDEEMAERNKWIFNAFENEGMPISDIAHEVGLSTPRIYQILNPPTSPSPKNKAIKVPRGKFKTPRDAAIADFEANDMHPGCKNRDMYSMCHHCFGRMMLVDCEYDKDG